MDGIVWEADARTLQITFISDQAERLLGYACREWLQPGFWIEHIFTRRIASGQRTTAPAAPHAKGSPRLRIPLHAARTGEVVWLHDVVTVVCENDQPRWLRGIMVDISRQKSAEAEIIAAQQHLQATLTALPDLLFEVDGKRHHLQPACA